jgi:CRISPR/Cas system-associated exonuclease Cas4 (RecB family)
MSIKWSYSSLKTFQQCPKKYFHLKVARDIKDAPTVATMYGQAVHKAAEDFVKDGTAIPEKFAFMQPFLDTLAAIPGEKHVEFEMGLTEDLKPCAFDAENAWWRGIADFLAIDEAKGLAYSVDYKTSRSARYADKQQLDLVAAAIFAHFPKITRIKSALLFVVSKEFVRAEHVADLKEAYVAKLRPDLARIEAAMENGVWNPITGPLCRFCPVKQCEHNRSD